VQALARRLATAPRRPWPARPVPVALVITELDLGGAEKALVALATGLNRALWSPRVIGLGPEGVLAAPIREAGVPVSCLAIRPRQPRDAFRRLVAALCEPEPPALVQSSLFHANVAARLAAPWARGNGKEPRPWVLSGLRVAERQKRWHLLLDRLTFRRTSGAVCVSEGVRRFSREAGGWPDDRLTVIPNAVDVALYDRAVSTPRESLGIPQDGFFVLYVGRLNVQKGLPVLLDAMERVLSARSGVYLALAGIGPERARLTERIAASHTLSGRVQLLGPRDDVPGLMRAADLLVLPSLWEGMPNVVLEAMAARRAVVATAVEGSEDLVVPGASGWLVPPGDPDALSAALLDAASDPSRLSRFGAAARVRVEAEYTPARTILAYERLWAGVLGLEHPQRD
jgi:glycosyltransferase involved in cell wall biosynthesis